MTASEEMTGRTIVLVSHDADLLENVVEETIVLRNKTLKYFEGSESGSKLIS